MIMMNMGITYNKSGKNSEAEELLSKSLAIREKILGDCESVAETHDHLASLYVDMEELDKAEHHYKEAIQIMERVYGPAHYFLRNPYCNLAYVYRKTGEVEKNNEQKKKYFEWKKLQEIKGNGEDKMEEKKQEEMTLEELIKFVTVSEP